MKELSKEDLERIEKASINHGDRYRMENACEDDFMYGAEYEHSIAYNQAIEDFKTSINSLLVSKFGLLNGGQFYMLDQKEIFDEIEKLKK